MSNQSNPILVRWHIFTLHWLLSRMCLDSASKKRCFSFIQHKRISWLATQLHNSTSGSSAMDAKHIQQTSILSSICTPHCIHGSTFSCIENCFWSMWDHQNQPGSMIKAWGGSCFKASQNCNLQISNWNAINAIVLFKLQTKSIYHKQMDAN